MSNVSNGVLLVDDSALEHFNQTKPDLSGLVQLNYNAIAGATNSVIPKFVCNAKDPDSRSMIMTAVAQFAHA